MINIAIPGLSPESCFLYVDDLVIFGCSIKHHNKNLTKVFQALRKFNLKLNPSKCQFLETNVTYLGRISDRGILPDPPDPSKYSVIKNFPVPTNANKVRRFVAFCNYNRRFVSDVAKIAYPLNQLVKRDVEFN